MRRVALAAAVVIAAGAAQAAFAQLLPMRDGSLPFPSAPVRPAPSIAGVWAGKYICGQGVTGLKLEVRDIGPNRISATFNFSAVKENPGVPSGSYTMEGVFDRKTRRLDLEPLVWREQPAGYVMVGLAGRLVETNDLLTGLVPDLGCSWFQLVRWEDPIA